MTIFLQKDKLQEYKGWMLPTYCDHFHSTIDSGMKNYYQTKCDDTVFSNTPNKNLAIDIGGNIGLMARRYAEVFDHVHTFEPVLENYSCLYYNTKELDNITLYPIGLGEEEKQETILLPKNASSCGDWSIVDFINTKESTRSFTIDIRTLDSFNLKPDFIKIDIQGYELSVLKGATETLKKYKPTLLIETVSAGKNISTHVAEFIDQFGYKQIKKINKDRIYKVYE